MPLELTSAGRPVRLSPGTSVQLELNSPLFDEDTIKGSFSYSFAVPAAPNGPLYGFPERPDAADAPGGLLPAELVEAGVPVLRGSQRVKSATPQRYNVAVQAGLSGAQLSERALSSFSYGGLRTVPRWVAGPPDGGGNATQVPGLMLHANEVVASPADYDYVFAPLRNEFISEAQQAGPGFNPSTLDVLNYPEATVNKWVVYAADVLGIPAGGSFTYNANFRVPGGLSFGEFRLLPPYCPFPKLRYVLEAVCGESGLGVDGGNLLPGELGELVLAGNAVLVDRGDAQTLAFSLADVLPALTVAQLLGALRQDLGIVVYVDPATGLVRSRYLAEQVAADAASTDLSTRLAGAPEVTIDQPAGLTLTYHVDGEDELTKDLLGQQPDPALLLPAVATVADLPASADIVADNPQAGQVRLVTATNTLYVCSLAYLDGVRVRLSWQPLVANLSAVSVAGGGNVQEQATCYTLERPTRFGLDTTAAATLLLPAISQPPYSAERTGPGAIGRSAELRLLFYNGLQLASDGSSQYPQLSHQSASGTYSLRLAGSAGTYEQLLRAWLPAKLSGVRYKQALRLSALDLARLDLGQPLLLAGVRYLVRKVSATVPLGKPAMLELVRL